MTKHHIYWTGTELSAVAEQYLDDVKSTPVFRLASAFMEAQRVLPIPRRHPLTWIYNAKNKKIFNIALTAERLRREQVKERKAKEPPAPPAPAVSQPPPVAETIPSGVSTVDAGGDLGAALVEFVERLGEALGRGLARGFLSQLPVSSAVSPLDALRAAGTPYLASDPGEARRNTKMREALANGGSRDHKPRVLIVGGRSGTLSELSTLKLDGLWEKLDLRHVSQEESAGVVKLRAGNADMAVVFARFCPHKLQDAAIAELGRDRVVVVTPERGLDSVRQVLEGMISAVK